MAVLSSTLLKEAERPATLSFNYPLALLSHAKGEVSGPVATTS